MTRGALRGHFDVGGVDVWGRDFHSLPTQAVNMTRLGCHRLRSNEVRRWLSVIAYNFGNLWRRLVLPQRIGNRSLTSLQQRLMKAGGLWESMGSVEATGGILVTARRPKD